MTVAELIKALSELPPDTPVFTLGYEGSYDKIIRTEVNKLKNTSTPESWWNGTHDINESGTPSVILIPNRR